MGDDSEIEKTGLSGFRMTVLHLPSTDRAKMLHGRHSFYCGRQHAHLSVNFDGSPCRPGTTYLESRLTGGSLSNLAAISTGPRKPDTPHGLPRQITERFTDLLLSDDGRPAISAPADPLTDEFVNEIMNASQAWASLQTARDFKGSVGSAAIAVSVQQGVPTTEPILSGHLWVEEWVDSANWIPKVVIEQRLVRAEIRTDKGIEIKSVWRTRMWDETHVTDYDDVEEDWGKEEIEAGKAPPEIPFKSSAEHFAGRCPVVWMQNTRCADEPEGREDYYGAYQQGDKLDKVRSFATRSTIANTDPTLVYKEDTHKRLVNPMVRKGHAARIDVSAKGDVKLLEVSGSAVKQAWETAREIRSDILHTTSCVILDHESAASNRSGEAIQLLWQAMEARASRMRVPLAFEIQQVAAIFLSMARVVGVGSVEDETPKGIILPPKRINPDDEAVPVMGVFEVGKGRHVAIKWGAYHQPTMTQMQSLVTALTTANGAKAVLSQRTTTEIAVATLSLGSVEAERKRMAEELEAEQDQTRRDEADLAATVLPGADPDGDDEIDRLNEKLREDIDKLAPNPDLEISSHNTDSETSSHNKEPEDG